MKNLNTVKETTGGIPVSNLQFSPDYKQITGIVEEKTLTWKVIRLFKSAILETPDLDPDLYNLDLKGILIPKVENHKYTFKKDTWHARYYKWVTDKEAHVVHKTMCPYFWLLVLFTLFSPIIVLMKMFFLSTSSAYEKVSKWHSDYCHKRKKRREARTIRFIEKMTDKRAYTINSSYDKRSKLLSYIDYYSENYDKYEELLREKAYNYYINVIVPSETEKTKQKEKEEVQLKERQVELQSKIGDFLLKVDDYMDNLFVRSIYYLIVIFFGILLAFLITKIVVIGVLYPVFSLLFSLLAEYGTMILAIFVPFLFLGLLVVLTNKLAKILRNKICGLDFTFAESFFCSLGNFFKGVYKYLIRPFVVLIVAIAKGIYNVGVFIYKLITYTADMLYNIYKRNCPLIIWEKEETDKQN